MLAASGTPEFFEWSSVLYGTPLAVLSDESTTSLALASQFDDLISSLTHVDLGAPPPACHLARPVADEMEQAVRELFGDEAPRVSVVDELSANALAGPRRIRVRRTACFTDKDVRQLVHHEAYVHVATSLNGLAQADPKILAAGHPGTTKTQEGLAVIVGGIRRNRRRSGGRAVTHSFPKS